MPIKNGKINESPDPKKPTAESVTKACLVIKLLNILNDKKLSSKLKEKAAHTLGSLCVGEKFPHTKNVLEGLLETAKQVFHSNANFSLYSVDFSCYRLKMLKFILLLVNL